MMDLTTNYMGLRLKNPLMAGASPMSRDVNSVRAMEDAGISAVVVYSLFEEQFSHEVGAHEHYESFGAESFPEALTYIPSLDYFPRGPEEYLEHVTRLKEAVDIPIIASLNGTTDGGWIDFSKRLEEAGVDGLELNCYLIATEPDVSAAGVEERYLDILRAVKRTVSIPVAMKLGPYFSSLAHFAKRLDEQGVDGLVLFNRFYQPDIDLETLEVVPNLVFSSRHEVRLPMRWIAILDPIVEASLAATTGVYGAHDVLKLLMVGADVTMLCAALLRNGAGSVVHEMLRGIDEWMEEHEYESLQQLQGSMNHATCSHPGAFERANYMQALQSFV